MGLVGGIFGTYPTTGACDASTPTCSGATATFGGVTDPYLAMAGLLGVSAFF